MKRILLILVLLLACIPTFARSLDTNAAYDAGFNELSDTDKADLIKQIADKKAAKSQAAQAVNIVQQTSPQKVNEWLDIGTRIGQGLAGAAKEVGVAVNDFAKSPVGMWTIALITWKFVGGVIVHVGGALVLWLVGFTFIWWINRRRVTTTVRYDSEKTDIFGRSRLISVEKGCIGDDDYVGMIVCGLLILMAGIIVMFTY